MTDDYLTPEQRLAERDDLEDAIDAKCFVDRFGGINLDNYPAREERKCQHESVSSLFYREVVCSKCHGSGVYRKVVDDRQVADKCTCCRGRGWLQLPTAQPRKSERGYWVHQCMVCRKELSNEPHSVDSEAIGNLRVDQGVSAGEPDTSLDSGDRRGIPDQQSERRTVSPEIAGGEGLDRTE